MNPVDQFFQSHFNTPLSTGEERKFANWARENGKNPANETIDYDLRGLYKSNQGFSEDFHGSDQFKKPSHPTFSDESQYSGTPTPSGLRYQGGHWDNPTPLQQLFGIRPSFSMSKEMATDGLHNPEFMTRYFQKVDPGIDLLYPFPPYRQGLRRQ